LAGVYVVQNRRFVYVNPKLAEIMGYDQSELIALPSAVAAIVADDRDIVEEKMTRRLAGATDSDHYYVRALRKSGEVIDLEIHSGSTTYIGRPATIGTVLDVTEQRRAEEQLRDSEVRFRTLFEEAPIGLVMTSLETRIQKVNQAFCDMLGYEETELIGRMVAEVTHPEGTGGTPESAKSVLGGAERIVRLHKRYIRKDGTSVEAETTLSLVKDSGGRPLYAVAMIEDVTEQRKLEDKLHQVLRLESVGQLAGGVAHNFNNALTAISGYSELLARRLDAEDPAMRDLEQIQRVAEQSAHLTRQLLAFSRQEDVHPSVFNLNEAVESTRDLLSPLLGDQLRIRLRLDRGLPSVSSDRTQLEQIITNLILNARDAMSQGGLLTIDTDAVEVDEAAARLNPEATPGRYVRMVVRDTGVGMQEETVARIFEPFFTTKEPGEGVGLGLAMVHGAVKQGGGFITVESTPDVGSTFTIFLPEFRETDTEERDPGLTPPTVH
jgi:PAS domain S-box-containing protein